MSTNTNNPNLTKILPADLFDASLYTRDNSLLTIDAPHKIPRILGICLANNLNDKYRAKNGMFVVMFEHEDGTKFWFHCTNWVYLMLLEKEWHVPQNDIKDLLDRMGMLNYTCLIGQWLKEEK